MKNQIHYDLVVEFEVLLDSELETIRGGVSASDDSPIDTTTLGALEASLNPSKPKPIPLPYPKVPENIPGLPTRYVK